MKKLRETQHFLLINQLSNQPTEAQDDESNNKKQWTKAFRSIVPIALHICFCFVATQLLMLLQIQFEFIQMIDMSFINSMHINYYWLWQHTYNSNQSNNTINGAPLCTVSTNLTRFPPFCQIGNYSKTNHYYRNWLWREICIPSSYLIFPPASKRIPNSFNW